MTDTNEKQWTVWYSIKDWFSNMFTSEAEAVLIRLKITHPLM